MKKITLENKLDFKEMDLWDFALYVANLKLNYESYSDVIISIKNNKLVITYTKFVEE